MRADRGLIWVFRPLWKVKPLEENASGVRHLPWKIMK